MDLFAQLWEQGHTMIVITHDKALARRTGRQIEFQDGRIVSQ
jgi:predicted ABC-type transport system involved in lysophospholipase L1 biosynthesis ATPase subunit